MSRAVRTSALLGAASALAVLALVTAGGAVAGSPQVHAARSCHLSSYEQRHLGATYVTSLRVRNTSCRTGKKVVRAFNSCRGSARGRCHHRVLGYACSESRSGISVQFNSKVSCKNGGRRVNFTYTQNT
jgi:hypothetical protein